MKNDLKIYRVGVGGGDERPVIDFELPDNAKNDWRRCDEVLRGHRDIKDYRELHIKVEHRDATAWDLYLLPGTFGLFSHRVIRALGPNPLRAFDLLHASLNDTDYYVLLCKETVACLNRQESAVIPFASNPNRIKEIRRHVFEKSTLDDPLCFCIPESKSSLFVTEGVRRLVSDAGLIGIAFEPVG